LANRTPDEHSSAVRFNNVFDNAQANPYALRLAPQLGAAPVEALENLVVFVRRDAVAVVFDPE